MWNLLNLLNIPLSLFQNMFNARMVRENNAHQSMLVDKQNKAAEAQAEKAYRRSLPSNQIAQMRSAGISDFGAAQAISGGATYNPAPVNTANTEASQMDLSGAMQAISTAVQLKQEMKMQDKLLAAQKAENEANRQTQKDIAQLQADTTNRNADARLDYDYNNQTMQWQMQLAEIQLKQDDLEFRKQSFEYGKKLVDANTSLTKAQRDKIVAELNEWKKEPFADARLQKARLESIAAEYDYRINEYDLNEYVDSHFAYNKAGDLVPIVHGESKMTTFMNATSDKADAFWNLVFSIIPARSVLKLFKK